MDAAKSGGFQRLVGLLFPQRGAWQSEQIVTDVVIDGDATDLLGGALEIQGECAGFDADVADVSP